MELAETQPVNIMIITLFMLGLQITALSMFTFGVAVVLLVDYKKILSRTSILLFFFLIYFLGETYHNNIITFPEFIKYFIYYFLSYQLGAASIIFNTDNKISNKQLFCLLYGFFVGFVVYLIINVSFVDQSDISSNLVRICTPSFGIMRRTATTYYLSPLIVLIPVSIYYYANIFRHVRKYFFEFVVLATITSASLYLTIIMDRVEPLAMLLLVSIIFVISFILNRKWSNVVVSRVYKMAIILVSVGGIYWLIFNTDIITKIVDGVTNSIRFNLWCAGIDSLIKYPLGGCNNCLIREYGQTSIYAHNMWLDVGRNGGIISILLLLFFQIAHIKYVWKIINYPEISEFLKSSLLILIFTLMMNYFVDPIFEEAPIFSGASGFAKSSFVYIMYGFFLSGLLKNFALAISDGTKHAEKV